MGWTWSNNHSLGANCSCLRHIPVSHVGNPYMLLHLLRIAGSPKEKRTLPFRSLKTYACAEKSIHLIQTQKIWPKIEHVVHLTSNIPSQIWRWLLAIGFVRFISAILEEPISGWLTRRGPHADDHRPGQDACEDQAILHPWHEELKWT